MNVHVDCRRVLDQLEAYLDGELPLSEQVHVEGHLRFCRTCAARMDDYRLIGVSLRRGASSGDDATALAAMRTAVVARARSDREQSLAWWIRSSFDDRRLVWPAIGATLAVVFGIGVTFAVLRVAADERPMSLAAMIGTLAQPGTERNPLIPATVPPIEWTAPGRAFENRSSGGISIPRVIDDGASLGVAPGDESEYTVAAVVSREGRIANYALLRATQSRGPLEARTNTAALQDAVRQSRFRPAQMPTGEAVAVNLIWVIVHQTVKGSFGATTSTAPSSHRPKPAPPVAAESPDETDAPTRPLDAAPPVAPIETSPTA